jgi:5-methylthioribose kinase
MSTYQHFSAEQAKQHVLSLGLLKTAPGIEIIADEIGDGNLNYVYSIRDSLGQQRIILKQAVPYVRCVGESWALTLDRARIEAEALLVHAQFCPEHVVKIHCYDKNLALMVMEDLSDYTLLRYAMNEQKKFPLFAEHVGTYLAKVLFFTSDFYMDQQEKKQQVAQFINPELCKITEDLFFVDPYEDHPRNRFNPLITEEVKKIWNNQALKLAVAKLKYKFLTEAQALLHGDVHSGSIFVTATNTKLIDAEFAYYGPMGFDVGSLLANFILNYCAQPGLAASAEIAQDYQQYILNSILEIWQVFTKQFGELMRSKTQDSSFKNESYQEYFLTNILRDTIAYAGTELIRRTIGLAHVKDLDSIVDDKQRAKCETQALQLGQTLVLNSDTMSLQDVCAAMKI